MHRQGVVPVPNISLVQFLLLLLLRVFVIELDGLISVQLLCYGSLWRLYIYGEDKVHCNMRPVCLDWTLSAGKRMLRLCDVMLRLCGRQSCRIHVHTILRCCYCAVRKMRGSVHRYAGLEMAPSAHADVSESMYAHCKRL